MKLWKWNANMNNISLKHASFFEVTQNTRYTDMNCVVCYGKQGSAVVVRLLDSLSPLRFFWMSCLLAGGQTKCVEMTPPGRQRFSFISLLPDRRRADIG